jgi:hypothetical protein
VYCNYQLRSHQTAKNIIGSLLRQAVQQAGPIPNEIRVWFEDAKRLHSPPILSEMKSLLFSTFRHTKRRIYIVIDGLDELQPQSLEFLKILRDGLAESSAPRIMVMSRPFPGFDGLRSSAPEIEINAHEDDMRAFVNARISDRLNRIISSDSALEEEIEESVIERSGGMYVLIRIKPYCVF